MSPYTQMGAFNLMETFFFLSLGISFILILLLVHHFKKRLNLLEQKCDTMFDIIQNVAKELKQIKTSPIQVPVFRDVVEERIKYDMNEVQSEEDDDDETATMANESEDEESESEEEVESDNEEEEVVEIESEEIVANKLEVFDLGEIQTEDAPVQPADYKKMSVPVLKKLVLAKGLRNDVGGLKKADLLVLLV
jgi:hypothetical protein